MNLPRKILVPLDFSEAAAPVLECAVSYAEAFDASLIVMHAADDPVLNAPSTSDEYRQRFEEELDEELNHLVGKDVRQRVNIQLVTTSGGAAVEVCSYAEQNDVDLIIMGTHGRGAIAKMILGSVADKVVRLAPCPVLTIRSYQSGD